MVRPSLCAASMPCACLPRKRVDACIIQIGNCVITPCRVCLLRVEMVCGQTPSFSAREKSSTARSLMGLSSSKTTHFTGTDLAG